MSIGIALGVTRDAILRVHHGVLEVLNDLVALVLGIEDGAVQVLCDLSGLLDGELVGGLRVAITLTGSHLVGQKLDRGREGPRSSNSAGAERPWEDRES